MCSSGDSDIKATEAAQTAFTQQLQQTFSTQFANQQGLLSQLQTALQPALSGTQGFTPAQMTTLQTQNTEGAAKDFAAAQTATNQAIAARGGSALPSGATAQLTAENANAGAAEKAAGDQNIQLANAQQEEENRNNAINAELGISSQENPTAYASEANTGSNTVADLGTAFKNSQSSQLLGTLGGIAGGGLTALGSYYGAKKP